jgi:short-subunit dehydrogenase
VNIEGSVAIVTGASSGIGAATAEALARRGATIVAVARRAGRLEEVVERCRASAPESIAHPGDVSERSFADDVMRGARERLGRVDILVNNAGISPGENVREHAVDDAIAIMNVNFFGAVHFAGAALPGLLAQGRGSIVNLTSVSGAVPAPGEPAYGASKAALSRWTHGLAIELHGTGVHAGVLSPGPIDTEIWQHGSAPYDGKLYPPSLVADGVLRMIERELTQLTVPRRFGAVGAMYPLVGRPMRWGLRKYGNRGASDAPDGLH